MRVHVAFTPGEQTPAPVGIVVDVLRATSTICQALASAYGAGRIAEALGGEPEDSARAAILLAHSFRSAIEGLAASRSAANLRRHGLEADVERCARENDLDVVPRYIRRVGPAAEVAL